MALNVLLLGPQGAGKGTQAKRIAAEYGIPHIASGEIGRSFNVVFALQIPDEVAFERLRRRAEIEGRPDDTDDAIRRRLENYHRETAPLIEYYRARGNLVPIHGERTENEVFAEIQSALEQVPA